MKALIPLAGLGSRMLPLTKTTAKPLIPVGNKAVISHIIEKLQESHTHEVVFIVGHLGDQIKEFVEAHHELESVYVWQKELSGQAPAIKLAEAEIDEDVLIWFSDTLIDFDLSEGCKTDHDGVLFVKEVEDPRRFGVIEIDENNLVTGIVEKPEHPKSNLVNIGLYYVKNFPLLIEAIDTLIKRDQKTKGEYYLMDAFSIMLKKGATFEAKKVDVWLDTGKLKTTLETNRYMVDRTPTLHPQGTSSSFTGNVKLGEGAVIEGSDIGPHVSVGDGSIIQSSTVTDAIIAAQAEVKDAKLLRCIVGKHTKITGEHTDRIFGDHEEV